MLSAFVSQSLVLLEVFMVKLILRRNSLVVFELKSLWTHLKAWFNIFSNTLPCFKDCICMCFLITSMASWHDFHWFSRNSLPQLYSHVFIWSGWLLNTVTFCSCIVNPLSSYTLTNLCFCHCIAMFTCLNSARQLFKWGILHIQIFKKFLSFQVTYFINFAVEENICGGRTDECFPVAEAQLLVHFANC